MNNNFPFHYIKFPNKDNKLEMPFIEQVNNSLKTNLQKDDSFGCKIENCHTHAGSKIHFDNFIEAELLFHNNYYNLHFAQLTFGHIMEKILEHEKKHNKKYNSLMLIGYENYSELYLHELKEILLKENEKNKLHFTNIEYCVYETFSSFDSNGVRYNDITIKGLKNNICKNDKEELLYLDCDIEKALDINKTLCFFIVPINTSLSTMDKMISKLCLDANIDPKNLSREHICLITLGPIDNSINIYWDYNEKESVLIPKNGKFEYLDENSKIYNIVFFKTSWNIASQCPQCFPDVKDNLQIEYENPMFGVNRGSVVPMLKIGKTTFLKPINPLFKLNKETSTKDNLAKVWELSQFMKYKHVVRGENHFQYYIETDKYLQKYSSTICDNFLEKVVAKKLKRNSDILIFDYIVAPRQHTNANWIHLVNEKVFNGVARIMYFDIEKEFRSNIKAKYSDLTNSLENIQNSNQEFYIRFHFVDDTINSGATFLRAKNLIMSLSSCVKDKEKISLFDSVILLINRLSHDNKKFYNNTDNFFSYIDVNISSMRKHDDACTLCKITYDYEKLKQECATNEMASICLNVIQKHKETNVAEVNTSTYKTYGTLEKRYLFFISHLLSERFSNKLSLKFEKLENVAIESESDCSEILQIINDYFKEDNIHFLLKKYNTSEDEIEEEFKIIIWKVAFIKTISRPFHTFHIRQRQAAFSFCIEGLSKLLNENNTYNSNNSKESIDIFKSLILIKTYVKALADMNANYIIRHQILHNLIEKAKVGDNLLKELIHDNSPKGTYLIKNLFTTESILHYVKKTVTLSRETTKSLLLEYILLRNNEKEFFKSYTLDLMPETTNFIGSNQEISIFGKLYLENNTILNEVLYNNTNLKKICDFEEERIKELYFFSNFYSVLKLNFGIKDFKFHEIFKSYRNLKESVSNFITRSQNPTNKKDFTLDISHEINNFFNSLLKNNDCQIYSLAFVRDKNEKNKLFQYFTLTSTTKSDNTYFDCRLKGLNITQSFYFDENIDEIRNKLEKITNNEQSTFIFIKDKLNVCNCEKTVILKFCEKSNNVNDDFDESIYIQIWGFNEKNYLHWFAIKLFMTLRNDFINLIKNINLQELIEERKIDVQKKALSINKATTHADSEKYFFEPIYLYEENNEIKQISKNGLIRKSYKKISSISSGDYEFILFDTYYQLLADEWISSLYRKLVRGEHVFFTDTNKDTFETLKNTIKRKYYMGSETESEDDVHQLNEINTEIYVANVERICKKLKLHFYFSDDEFNNKKCNFWKTHITGFKPISHIITILSLNAVKHAKMSNYEVNILFNKNGITFENSIPFDRIKEIEENLEVFTKIPPWVFPKSVNGNNKIKEGNHITLWTLIQSYKIDDYIDEKDRVIVNAFIKKCNDKAIFCINLKLFK